MFQPRLSLAIALVATAGLVAPLYAALDETERKIVASVDRAIPEALALLERTVNVNSGTMNFAGVRAVGALFEPELKGLGFETRWVDGGSWKRAGHLIATRDGRGRGAGAGAPGRRILLIGHLDTVFEPDSPFQRYEAVGDSAARGPGTTDMKGGIVVMLVALQALRDAGVLDRLPVRVVLTGDEENAGEPVEKARADLLQTADWADVAIGFEDGDGDPRTAVIARRGSSSWQLRVAGQPSHSSQIFRPDVGHGAIFEAARILNAFRDSLAGQAHLTFNPGAIVGGTSVAFDSATARGTAFGKNNVVAESTLVAGDLRALTLDQRAQAQAAMRRIVERGSPKTSATLTFDDRYPPLAPSEGNLKLLGRFDQASRDLGLGPVGADDPDRAGAADVSFCEGRVDAAIDGLGLMGSGGHTVRELADLRTLPVQAKRVAVMLARLAK